MCKGGIRKYRLAHRMVWEAFVGPIPDGLETNHKDSNRTNAGLSNLELMTRAQNVAYEFSHNGRKPANNPSPGSRNGSSKLTEADIPRIIAMHHSGVRQKDIGALYGVSQRAISLITRREKWKHVIVPTSNA